MRSKADLLIKLGGVLFSAGFAALLGVLLVGDSRAADPLLGSAMALIPVGFCVAAAGLLLDVRSRMRASADASGDAHAE